jgi:hypothetical protein
METSREQNKDQGRMLILAQVSELRNEITAFREENKADAIEIAGKLQRIESRLHDIKYILKRPIAL